MLVILVIGCHKYLSKLDRWYKWESIHQDYLQNNNRHDIE